MMDLLKESVDEWNAKRGDLPEIVMRGSSIQMDHYILFLDSDQLPSLTDYVLVLRVEKIEESSHLREKASAKKPSPSREVFWGGRSLTNSSFEYATANSDTLTLLMGSLTLGITPSGSGLQEKTWNYVNVWKGCTMWLPQCCHNVGISWLCSIPDSDHSDRSPCPRCWHARVPASR